MQANSGSCAMGIRFKLLLAFVSSFVLIGAISLYALQLRLHAEFEALEQNSGQSSPVTGHGRLGGHARIPDERDQRLGRSGPRCTPSHRVPSS